MEPQRPEQQPNRQQEFKKDQIQRPVVPSADIKPSVRITTETTAAQWVCMVMGVAFILLGLGGFVLPNLFGMHLGWGHNIVHLVSGVFSLWFGVGKSDFSAERFSYIFATIYGVLGVAGFLFGQNTSLIPPTMDYDSFWWRLIPGSMELGTADHVVHLLIGGIFVIGSYLSTKRIKNVAPKGTLWH